VRSFIFSSRLKQHYGWQLDFSQNALAKQVANISRLHGEATILKCESLRQILRKDRFSRSSKLTCSLLNRNSAGAAANLARHG
jgi:hypothetical protein